ncbi:MAG: DUF624 domain-containing protein [Lachnospiraceae bacterium]|nr:DUF624 domain-containing protein [Lachnospiraceae bacterium]
MRLFDLDGPLMSILNKIADMMILNILAIICCLPIFTAGATFTALHYVCLKIVRNEEGYIVRSFFKAFKENFKQATIIWMVALVAILFLIADFWLIAEYELNLGYWFKVVLMAVFVLVIFTTTFVFPALAKFSNTTLQTVKNAFAMSVLQFPKTILMIIIYVLPVVAGIFFYQAIPFVLLFGISVPVFLSAMLYNKFFKGLEEKILEHQGKKEAEDDGEKIFSDAPMEGISDK